MQPEPLSVDALISARRPTGLVPLHLSSDGRWLTFSVRPAYQDSSMLGQWTNEEVTGSQVLVFNTTTGETTKPFPTAASSWGGQWSPDGRWLVAYAFAEGAPRLALWEVETGNSRMVPGVQVRPGFGCEVPQWLPDSRTVVLKLAPETEEADAPGLTVPDSAPEQAAGRTVLSFNPTLDESKALQFGENASFVCDLSAVEIETGAVHRLLAGVSLGGWRVAPDAHAVASLRHTGRTDWDRKWWSLIVAPLDGSPPREIAADLQQSEFGACFNWSPDSQRIAYISLDERSRKGRLFTIDAGGATGAADLTGEATLSFSGEGADSAAPCWSDDGMRIYLPGNGATWAFAANGKTQQRLAPSGNDRLRYWLQRPTSGILTTVGGRALLAVVRDPATKNEGIVRIDLATGQAVRVAEVARSFGRGDDISKVEAAMDGSVFYSLLEAAHRPREVWRFRARSRRLERLAAINPHFEGPDLGNSQLIEFRSLDGETRQAALLLPAGYRGSQRVPVVVQLYNGNYSNWIHYFGLGDYGPFNGNLLTSRGIGFLRPDLPLKHGDPLKQLPGLVLPAVHRLVEMGIADPERIGLAGFSYGCYLVLALLTQMSLFRAAVAVGGQVNLTSRYGALTLEGESYGMAHCESADAQGLGGSLWEKREAYIENSPLFYLDRVRTPVLLVAGTADPDDANQAAQAFSALRRLGQQVELRLYHGEDHSPAYWSLSGLRDLCDRVVSWFEAHLSPSV